MSKEMKNREIKAGFIGNVIEWYDFALYGYMAGILAALFFPSEDKLASLIAVYGVFAAGFFMRPLGAGFFGWLGDTIGRSKTMLLSVTMMTLPTLLLGMLPTYDTAGIWAVVMLVIIRLIQGLSVGGEFSSSVTYLVESAPDHRRGFFGSFANTGTIVGMLLGSGVAALATTILSDAVIHDWGWRIPFLLGGVFGGIAIWMRRDLPESKHFKPKKKEHHGPSPLKLAFTSHPTRMIKAILFAAAYGIVFYLPLVYLPEWLHSQTGMPRHEALQINTLSTALLLGLVPVTGIISDHYIRRSHFIAGAMVLMALVSFPAFDWLANDGLWGPVAIQFIFVILLAVPLGSAPAMFVELFPSSHRLSAYSVAYNLGVGVIGGLTPMLATWLIKVSGAPVAPSFLLIVGASVAFITILWIGDRSREKLID